MKSISLTKEDISKLLEILNYLYNDNYIRINLNEKEATFYKSEFEYDFIPWYELVIEKVIPNLFKFSNEHITTKFITSDNKIDILYSEFNSIKNIINFKY